MLPTCEVDDAEHPDEACGVPHHVRQRAVHQHVPQRNEDAQAAHVHPAGVQHKQGIILGFESSRMCHRPMKMHRLLTFTLQAAQVQHRERLLVGQSHCMLLHNEDAQAAHVYPAGRQHKQQILLKLWCHAAVKMDTRQAVCQLPSAPVLQIDSMKITS
jgi:hypothetical protein